MAPTYNPDTLSDASFSLIRRSDENSFGNWRQANTPEGFVTEGWGEGVMLGSLMIMGFITVANMRKRVLLHKLILLELLLAMSHGTFCFMSFHGYGWYLSSTAALLYSSYFTHNVVAWIKIRPFFTTSGAPGNTARASFTRRTCRIVRWIYLSTLGMTVPILIFEIYNNFRFFNNLSQLYKRVRPYEPLIRDPWWLFSVLTLFYVIKKSYSKSVVILMKRSPRFGILLAAIFLSMVFTTMDILASIIPSLSVVDGINPYWKLALVFKCLTDNIMLDDFQTALNKLRGAAKLNSPAPYQPTLAPFATSEKAESDGGEIEDSGSRLMPSRSDPNRFSLSGRALDNEEVLDSSGRGRRKQSMIAKEAVGRVGTKIYDLPSLKAFLPRGPKEKRRAETQTNTGKKTGTNVDKNLGMDMEESIDPAIPDLETSPTTALNGPSDRELYNSTHLHSAGPGDRAQNSSSDRTDKGLLDRDERWLPAMAEFDSAR